MSRHIVTEKWRPNPYRIAQKQNEFTGLLELIKEVNCKSYLEVGARHGGAFFEVVSKSLPKDAIAIAVDLPGGTWGQKESEESLRMCVEQLRSLGWTNVHCIFGDSTSSETLEKIKQLHTEKFDATFIDGDHRLEGCTKDWEIYSPITEKLVFFHDIDGRGIVQKSNPELIVEVPILWDELKKTHDHKEFIDNENEPERKMGIGVIIFTEVFCE